MSVGLPVIACNLVGNLDTVENEISGYLYDLKDLSIAVKYIKKLAKDVELRNSIGYNSFKRLRKFFSKEKMILKYKYLYKRIYQEISS